MSSEGSGGSAESGRRGQLFIVSAPSGTGKTTLVERLVSRTPGLRRSRSYTSRPARAGEQDGVDYNFVTREQFEAMTREGAFLESAAVFGNYYGTGAADTEALLARGEDVVLVIDVQGARHKLHDCRDLHDNRVNYGGQPFIPAANPVGYKRNHYY
jgi:guanylate kinase